MAAKPYREGDWFAVPLRDGNYARGRLARASRSGVLLGYFFGPALTELPQPADLQGISASRAILVGHFGHLGLMKRKWPVVFREDAWDPKEWRCNEFLRHEELTGRNFVVRYADDDPGKLLGESMVAPETTLNLPKDGMMGAGFVEAKLTRLLRPDAAQS
jgi:hypothetical protein